jgi:Mg2+ and Co2+ transporter CorA
MNSHSVSSSSGDLSMKLFKGMDRDRDSSVSDAMRGRSLSSVEAPSNHDSIISKATGIFSSTRPFFAKTDTIHRKQAFKRHESGLFNSASTIMWTILDQYRLESLERLHSQVCLEYHNNVHMRAADTADSWGVSTSDAAEACVEIASVGWKFENSRAGAAPLKTGKVTALELAAVLEAVSYAANVSGNKDGDVSGPPQTDSSPGPLPDNGHASASPIKNKLIWINILNLDILPLFAQQLNWHPVALTLFADIRAYSTIVHLKGAHVIALCYFRMESDGSTVFNKLYIYISESVVVTFEVTVMKSSSSRLLDDEPLEGCCSTVFSRWGTVRKMIQKYGSLFLVYELGQQVVSAQDTLLEFIAITLAYFRKQATTHLLHSDKLKLIKNIHCLEGSVNMIQHFMRDNYEHLSFFKAIPKMHAAQAVQHSFVMASVLLNADTVPFMTDLVDSFLFTYDCITNEVIETGRLSKAVDMLGAMREGNAAMSLSLVATIFLPATFLTGVFGMNFIDPNTQHYFIRILNHHEGVYYFYTMCAIAAGIALAVFTVKVSVCMRWWKLMRLNAPAEHFAQPAVIDMTWMISPSVWFIAGLYRAIQLIWWLDRTFCRRRHRNAV